MQLSFGAGRLIAYMTKDAAGATIAVPQAVQFGVIQNADLDISFEEKLLYGSKQFPVAVARGKGTIEVKAKAAQIDGRMYGDFVFGSGSSAGELGLVPDYSTTVPSTPHTVTISPPNSGTFGKDLGVRNGDTGLPLARVASSPATGQYSVNEATGVYTFASADEDDPVLISYDYTATSTTARKGTISNLQMGYTPFFGLRLQREYAGKKLFLSLLNCASNQFASPAQNDDFNVTDITIQAFSNDADIVGYWSTSE